MCAIGVIDHSVMACIIQTGLHDILKNFSCCPACNVALAISCECWLLMFTYQVQSSVCFQCTYCSCLAEDMAEILCSSVWVHTMFQSLQHHFYDQVLHTLISGWLVCCKWELYLQKHEIIKSQCYVAVLCLSLMLIQANKLLMCNTSGGRSDCRQTSKAQHECYSGNAQFFSWL